MQVLDLHRIPDRAPVVADNHIVELAQLHRVVLEKLPHHRLVLRQRQALAVDVVVRVLLIQRVAPLEPTVIAAVRWPFRSPFQSVSGS